MSNSTHYIRGKGHWMKILGAPVPNYAKDGHEWTMDITPDEDGVKLLKSIKLGDRLKNKDDERGEFIQFRQRALRQDGTPNKPITVVGPDNKPWDPNVKIGNGSVVDVKFNVKDYGPGKKKGVYPQAVRILEHVEYAPVEFAPLNEDDEFFRAEEPANDEEQDLDDEVA